MMQVRKPVAGLAMMLVTAALMLGAAVAWAQTVWPNLPTTGFITGHVADGSDVDKGNAVFAVKSSKPLAVAIPQYGILIVPNLPVIVVQAEEQGGKKMFGVRDLQGGEYVVLGEHLKLLGTKKPQS
jgi:hypothetical protein